MTTSVNIETGVRTQVNISHVTREVKIDWVKGLRGEKGDTGLPTSGTSGQFVQFVDGEFVAQHSWITLATAFTADPVLLFSNATTEIYQYQYGSTTLYRSITDAQDAFYQAYDNTSHALTGLIASKQISISV